VQPLVNKYLHQRTIAPERLPVILTENINASFYDCFLKLEVQLQGGSYVAKQVENSASLAKYIQANPNLFIPGMSKGYKAGEIVEVELHNRKNGLQRVAECLSIV